MLEELGEVTLVAVTAKQTELSGLCKRLLDSYHPLGSGPLCGAQQRYLIRSEHARWVGALTFSAATWHLRGRDAFIGWSPRTRRANLHKVVANSRYLLLPGVRVPHLASHVLGLAARTIATDWQSRYGYSPVLLELRRPVRVCRHLLSSRQLAAGGRDRWPGTSGSLQ